MLQASLASDRIKHSMSLPASAGLQTERGPVRSGRRYFTGK